MDEDFDLSGLVGDYIDDTGSTVDILDGLMLEFERSSQKGVLDTKVIGEILGYLHTLKGNSGMMGYHSIEHYIHELENVYKLIDSQDISLTEQVVTGLFDAVSVLRNAVNEIAADNTANPDVDGEKAKLENIDVKTVAQPIAVVKTKNNGNGNGEQGAGAQSGDLGVAGEANVSQADASNLATRIFGAKSSTLRVDFERLDALLNRVGELIIARTRLSEIAGRLVFESVSEEFREEFTNTADDITKISQQLQDGILRVRMLPISQVFDRFHRLVRDLSKDMGKVVELTVEGGDTELDKTLIDQIGEPLIHLVRNAVDHGIEVPSARKQQGKAGTGRLTLSAVHEGNQVVISVSDDGHGIDVEKVRAKAIERGVINAAQELTKDEMLNLVFLRGMSTKDQVTEISGRGIGMDVVRDNILQLGGSVTVSSDPGAGSRFEIRLPLSLAIISALHVRVAEEFFSIPLTAVLESRRIDRSEIEMVNERQVFRHRGELIPIVRLAEALQVKVTAQPLLYYLVICIVGEQRVGLLVHELLGQQDLVVKSLSAYTGEPRGVGGAAVLADGSVILILDISHFLNYNVQVASVAEAGSPTDAEAQ